jgi:putative transposase
MPRRARLAIANVAWHIIQRGNNRGACFFSEGDYLCYLRLLAQQSEKHGGQCFVQHINRTYERSGTLWEGRFKSCLAQNENYALHCYRYIELNPVRANMTSHPGDYRWSSFRHNGGGLENDLITPHPSYLNLGDNASRRQATYRSLVESGVSEDLATSIRSATNGNFVLGSKTFSREIERALNRRASRLRSGRPVKVKS